MADLIRTGTGLASAGRASVAGLAEFEKKLAQLRNLYDVKTGGVIIRALREAAKVVVREAKARAPQIDPNFAKIGSVEERQAAWERGKAGRGRGRGQLGKKPTGALIKANIVEHAIPVNSRLAGGVPTVLVRVRNRGYTRRYSLSNPKGTILWNRPGSSPGYWWWVEFGTSRFPARSFMRPAFHATISKQLETFKAHMRKEIDYIVQNKSAPSGRALGALRKAT